MEPNPNNIFKVDGFTNVPVTTYINRHRVLGTQVIVNINGVEVKLNDAKEILSRVENSPALIFSSAVEALASIKVVSISEEDGFVSRDVNFDKFVERINNL